MINTVILEKTAAELRNILEIDSKTILNPSHLEELSKKIEEHLEGFNIISNSDLEGTPYLLLENENSFTIHIYGRNQSRFFDLVEQLTFAITLDKKSLNQYELQHSEFSFPRISSGNKAAQYLMLAFMMPPNAFYSAMVPYTSGDGSSIDIFKMQEEVNKYCYQRGRDLQLW